MKKLLLSTMMLAAGLFISNAAESTIDFSAQGYSNQQAVAEANADQVTITFARGENKSFDPKYYTAGTAVRMYAGNTVTFSVPQGGSITAINMDLRDYKYNTADSDEGYTVSSGTFTADPKTTYKASWTGNAQEVTIGIKNQKNSEGNSPQLGIKKITFTYTAGVETKCATPKFSVAAGTYFDAQSVELKSSTDGATIVYTVNGGAETTYNAPIALTNAGTYTIEAYAKKDGLENSDKASATYEIKSFPYAKMDPNNVKEGRYVIAYNEGGKFYIMKNEVYNNHYVTGTEYDLASGIEPEAANIFNVKKADGGYYITNSEGTYVALVKSGTYTNLKPAETTPFVWTFSGTEDAVVATADGFDNSFLQFTLYQGKTPEFLAHSKNQSPVFYNLDSATPSNQVAAPQFSVKAGTYYTKQSIELNTTTEGATIAYQINDGAEQNYTAPIEISAVGTYTIKAYAKKDGMDNSSTVTNTYEIKDAIKVASITDFIIEGSAEGDDAVFEWTFPVTVTAQMPSYTYVKDENEDVMLIFGDKVPTYKKGDVIPAGIKGSFKNYKGLYEMQFPIAETFASASGNIKLQDVVMEAGKIAASDINKIFYLDNVTYEEVKDGDKVTSKTLGDNSGKINVFYPKGWNIEGPESGTVTDAIVAVAVYNNTLQVYPLEFRTADSKPNDDASVSEVADNGIAISAIDGAVVVNADAAVAEIYNAAGQLVRSANVEGEATIAVPAGFYVVKAGNTVAKVIVR